MKKNQFAILLCSLFGLLLWCCSTDNGVDEASSGEVPVVTLYAGYGSDDDSSTRTTLDEFANVKWSATDVINVNGETSTQTTLLNEGAKAVFAVAATAPYYAMYSSIWNVKYNTFNTETHTFTFPFSSVQVYMNNLSFNDGANPSVAVSTTQHLTFYNVCGIVKAQIKANLREVRKIRFLSADNAVAGSAIVDPSNKSLRITGSTKSMDVDFQLEKTLTPSSPLTIRWVLPTGTYGAGWKIQMLDTEDYVLMEKTFQNSLTVSRSKTTNMGTFVYTSDDIPPVIQAFQSGESNCYIVAPGDSIYIPVSLATKGNPDNFPSGASFTCGVEWSDEYATMVRTAVEGRYIKVTADCAAGNSVVFAKNASGDIVWSWHIWVTDYNPDVTNVSYNGLTWMNRNLGATTTTVATVTTNGLLYQWGRKDPFPGAVTINDNSERSLYSPSLGEFRGPVKNASAGSNLLNSIKNPITFYKGTDTNEDDWYSASVSTHNDDLWSRTKTIYDPCPSGWKVPRYTSWVTLSKTNFLWSDADLGCTYTGSPTFYYPSTGWRDSGGYTKLASWGTHYWSSTRFDGPAYSFCFSFYSDAVKKYDIIFRSAACSVRCVKEE